MRLLNVAGSNKPLHVSDRHVGRSW